jgi:hypothetical protein
MGSSGRQTGLQVRSSDVRVARRRFQDRHSNGPAHPTMKPRHAPGRALSWFPVHDRNPQTFVPSIYGAKPADFVAATQRIFTARTHASHVTLPVVSR